MRPADQNAAALLSGQLDELRRSERLMELAGEGGDLEAAAAVARQVGLGEETARSYPAEVIPPQGSRDRNRAVALDVSFVTRRLPKPIGSVLPEPAVSESASSRYPQIVADVRQAVDDGRLVAHDLVPAVGELARWYGVARSTAQRAISTLAGEGLVRKAGGRYRVAGRSTESL